MDIIVTIPAGRIEDVKKEEQEVEKARRRGEEVVYYWHISNRPTKLKPGERVYFVESGQIRTWHRFIGFAHEPEVHVVEDGVKKIKRYKGWALILAAKINKLDKPLTCKGIQGFRYFDRWNFQSKLKEAFGKSQPREDSEGEAMIQRTLDSY